QDVGQHLARAAQARQQRHRARMLGQRAEEHGPVDPGRVALEVVERHVRVWRCRELGEQTREDRRQQLGVARWGGKALEIGRRRIRIRDPELTEGSAAPGRRAASAGGQEPGNTRVQTAASPVSPVRILRDSLTGSTNTLPSPMEPVLAAPVMVATTFCTSGAGPTTSIFPLGRESTVYSEPR